MLIHLFDGIGDIIFFFAAVGYVFKHILSRHFEHIAAFFIHQQRLHKLIPLAIVFTWHAEHQIDDLDIRWHCHTLAPENYY